MSHYWERIIYHHPETGMDYAFLYRFDITTGTHEFKPEWPGVYSPITDFRPERALQEAIDRCVSMDTPEGYLQAARYRDMLNGIKKRA